MKKKFTAQKQPDATTEGKSIRFFESLRPLYWYVTLVACILIVYAQTLSFGYTGFDDETLVKDSIPLLKDVSNIPSFFTQDVLLGRQHALFYRPVQMISYMLDTVIGGPNPSSYHASNVLIHCVATGVLFYLFLFLRFRKLSSFFFAALFALHPVSVQSAAWIPSRGDLLIGLFGVLTFLHYVKFIEGGRIIHVLLHALFFMCSVFSKETAVVLPLLLVSYSFLTKKDTFSLKRIVTTGALWSPILILWYVLRNIALQGNTEPTNVGIIPLLTNLPTIPVFISKFFLPVGLSPMPVFTTASTLGGVIIVVALLGWAFYSKRIRAPLFLFGGLWFLLFLLPGMWGRHMLGTAAYEYLNHRLYFPVVGLMIALFCLGAQELLHRNTIALSVGVAILLACGMYSAVLAGNYSDYDTFNEYMIKTNPQCALAYANRGVQYRRRGQYDTAMADFDAALRLAPLFPEAYYGKGSVYMKRGELALAEREFSRSLQLKATSYEALNARGIVRYMRGNLTAALTDITDALRVWPSSAEAYANRGTVYLNLRRIAEAEADFNEAIRLQSDFAQAYIGLGGIRTDARRFDEALTYFNKAIAVDPKSPDGYSARGVFKLNLEDYTGAIVDMNEAIRIAPNALELYLNRSLVYELKGEYESALRDLTTVIRGNPNNAPAYARRASMRHKTGDANGACDDWNQAVKWGDSNAATSLRQFCH